jgi:two-component system cell cycle response regulator
VDIVFRLGGEEFAVLLPSTDTLEAYAVAERIRVSIQDDFVNYSVPVTVSCGVATRRKGGLDRKQLLRAADEALYRAKAAGRNRTVAYDAESDGDSELARSVK